MKVLITGGSGYLSWELVRQLKQRSCPFVVVASSDPAKLAKDPAYAGVECVDNRQIWSDDDFMRGIDVVIHTAFCRKSLGNRLMQSLQFSKRLYQRVAAMGVKALINVSSQSVFGSQNDVPPKDDDPYAPDYLYALAKSAGELLLETIMENTDVTYTSVRLASLVGPSKDVPVNVLYKFVEAALHGNNIHIQGGKQEFSFLDVRDAADAIIRIVELPLDRWYPRFNLGPKDRLNIIDLAEKAVDYAARERGTKVQIHLTEDDTLLHAGMDSSRLYSTLDWTPRFSIEDTIASTGENIKKRDEMNNA